MNETRSRRAPFVPRKMRKSLKIYNFLNFYASVLYNKLGEAICAKLLYGKIFRLNSLAPIVWRSFWQEKGVALKKNEEEARPNMSIELHPSKTKKILKSIGHRNTVRNRRLKL
jgi:hypothetical protein